MKKSLFIVSAFALLSTVTVKAQFSSLNIDKIAVGTQGALDGADPTKIATFQDSPSTSNGVFIHNSGSTTMGDKSTENTKALLELSSNNKGFLPTRLTTEQITAIGATSTDAGMVVYDTTKKCLSSFDGTNWSCIGASSGNGIVFSKRFDVSGDNASTEDIIFDNVKMKFQNESTGWAVYPYIGAVAGTQPVTYIGTYNLGGANDVLLHDETIPSIYPPLSTTYKKIITSYNPKTVNYLVHQIDISVNDKYYEVKWWAVKNLKTVYVVVTKFQ